MTKTFKITIGILILLALAAAGVVGVSKNRKQQENDEKKQVATTETEKDENIPIQNFSISNDSIPQKFIFLDKNTKTVNLYDNRGNKLKEIYTENNPLIVLKDAKYYSKDNKLALLKKYKKDGKVFADIVVIDLKNNKEQLITSESHKDKEQDNNDDFDISIYNDIFQINEFSPDGTSISYRNVGYEYCRDEYYFFESQKTLGVESCGTTKWSPSGNSMVYFSTPGMITGSSFGFMTNDKILSQIEKITSESKYNNIKFTEFNWQEIQGDKEKLFFKYPHEQSKEHFTGIDEAFFIDENNLLVAVYDNDTSDPYDRQFYIFDRTNKKISEIKNEFLVKKGTGFMYLIGGQNPKLVFFSQKYKGYSYFNDDQQVYLADFANQDIIKLKKINLNLPISSYQNDYRTINILNNNNESFIMSRSIYKNIAIYDDEDENGIVDNLITNQFYYADFSSNVIKSIIEGNQYVFAGWPDE